MFFARSRLEVSQELRCRALFFCLLNQGDGIPNRRTLFDCNSKRDSDFAGDLCIRRIDKSGIYISRFYRGQRGANVFSRHDFRFEFPLKTKASKILLCVNPGWHGPRISDRDLL